MNDTTCFTSFTGFSSSKCCCIVYTSICLLRFLWNNIFFNYYYYYCYYYYYMHIFKMGKTIKEGKKEAKSRGMFICCIKLQRKYRGKKVWSSSKKLKKMFLFFTEINFHKGVKSWGTYSCKLRATFQCFGTCCIIIMNKSFVLLKSVTTYKTTMQCFQQAKRRYFQIIRLCKL